MHLSSRPTPGAPRVRIRRADGRGAVNRHGAVATVLVGSNASVVADEGIRDELFRAIDIMADCLLTALEE
ncbi:MAG TPA: hypothetical protein VFI46_18460 [Jiangellaceae bacterium]|nr:hypothetical protein [Jiangellaceae bacterium]